MKITRKLWLGGLVLFAAVMATCLVGAVSISFAETAAVAVGKIRKELDNINTASQELIRLYNSINDKNTAERLKPDIDAAIRREENAEKALADEMRWLDPNNEQHEQLLKKAFDDIEKTDVDERTAWVKAVQRQVDTDVAKEAATEKDASNVINAPR
jgi:hypothetical protein